MKTKVTFVKRLVNFVNLYEDLYSIFFWLPVLCMALIFAATFLIPSLFGVVFVSLQFIFAFSTVFIYATFFPKLDKRKIDSSVVNIKLVFYLLFSYVFAASLWAVGATKGLDFLMPFAGFTWAFSSIVYLLLLRSKGVKKISEKLHEGLFNIYEYELTIKQGDIVLCHNKEVVEKKVSPLLKYLGFVRDSRVVLKLKDRFVHLLILGPTGSGKTSQTLLPMVNQDTKNHDVGIIVIEPKGDFAQQAYFIALHNHRSDAVYFDASLDNCPHFNPLMGREADVVETMTTSFKMMQDDSSQYFKDMNEQLVRNAVKVLKRLDRYYGKDGVYSNLINLNRLVQNTKGFGTNIVTNQFNKVIAATTNPDEKKDSEEVQSYFTMEYFPEKSKAKEATSGVRSLLAKLCSNEFLRDILNPDIEAGEKNEIDFVKALEEGSVLCISTSQGALGDLGRFLGYFLILQFQAAVFARPGTEDTRRPCFLYIDEFQKYANKSFADMLTQGRSYRVSCNLATQGRSSMGMGSGRESKAFVDLVSTNARNLIIFPGGNSDDAQYYANQFGESMKTEVQTGISRKTFSPITGGFTPLGHPTETVREVEKLSFNFTPTDIMQRPFGEITYQIIKDNSIQQADVGKIEFIPKSLKDELDAKIPGYLRSHQKKTIQEIEEEARKNNKERNIEWKSLSVNDTEANTPAQSKVCVDANSETVTSEEPILAGSSAENAGSTFEDDAAQLSENMSVGGLEEEPEENNLSAYSSESRSSSPFDDPL